MVKNTKKLNFEDIWLKYYLLEVLFLTKAIFNLLIEPSFVENY